MDVRVANLAKILVGYSTRIGEGETVAIEGSTAAEPLVAAVYDEVLAAGGHPVVSLSFDGQAPAYYRGASAEQLKWISPLSEWFAEEVDCRIAIGAETNTRQLSRIDPARQRLRDEATRHLMQRTMERAAEGSHRWVYTLYPTNAYASDAEMSRRDFEDFYFHACLADDDDPLGAWRRASAETHRLAEWVDGHEEIHLVAPGTDLRLGIAGRKMIPCDGEHNMPDGEFFTGPVEDSVEGEVSFHLPSVIGGREVSGVKLRFESGRVVDAAAERGEEFLIQLLDTDDGARRLGEVGIGTNYGITQGTRDVLLDEKIGGTVHLAVGASYPESGGVNQSAVHTDMVCDMRQGGRIEVDGELLQEDGKFVV